MRIAPLMRARLPIDKRTTSGVQYHSGRKGLLLGGGVGRRPGPRGLPWSTFVEDVRLVERVRSPNFGPSSTASNHLLLALGGHEVVADRLLKSATTHRVTAAIAAVVLGLAGGACSDGGAESTTPRTTTTSSTTATVTTASSPTSTSVASEEAAARAGYEAASRAFIEAAANPDPDSVAVASTHTGLMLDQRRATLRGLRAEGKAIRYPTPSQYRIEIEEVSIDGDVARLTACVVDDGATVDAASGATLAGATVTTKVRAAMKMVDGSWRLAERVKTDEWDGVAGCAAD